MKVKIFWKEASKEQTNKNIKEYTGGRKLKLSDFK